MSGASPLPLGARLRAWHTASGSLVPLPWWAETLALPLINLFVAFLVSGLLVYALIGANPFQVGVTILQGAFGDLNGLCYTLYYTTTYIFAGLAVAVAFHGGLFNIGVDGQGQIAGLGIAFACLSMTALPWFLAAPLTILAGMILGALWAFIPGYLQAKRGSHIVITTIMFNNIAAPLVQYVLRAVMMKPGAGEPKSALFPANATLPSINDILAPFGIAQDLANFNVAFVLALLAALFVWLLIWRTRFGYALRTVGQNPAAAVYAGISPQRIVILTMLISGALASLMGVNILMGDQHRMILDYTAGAGFIGIAVCLMGRSHPAGIVLAALLFGALVQGGSELSLDYAAFDKNMIVMIQGLIILFVGALEFMFRPELVALIALFSPRKAREA